MTKPKDPKDYKKMGKPPFPYDEYIAQEICEQVATTTHGIKRIIQNNPHFPCEEVIRKWRFKFPEFARCYAEAKRMQAELLAEEVVEICDDGTNDYYTDNKGNEQIDFENIQRSRLRVDTRKWLAGKLAPKIYGEKQVVEQHTFSHEDSLKSLDKDPAKDA